MQQSATFSSAYYSIPVNSPHILDGGQENPDSLSDIPYTSSMPNMNGVIPHLNSHRMNGRRFSAGSTLSALYESNNEHNMNTPNNSNNCSETSRSDRSTVGGMIGARNNSSMYSGPKYSLEMLIAALDSPTEKKQETQPQRETSFVTPEKSQEEYDNAVGHGNGDHTKLENEPLDSQSATLEPSSENVWRPWTTSGEYISNPAQRFTQRMDYGMGYQGTMGYNANTNFAQAPTFWGHSSNAGSMQNNNKNNDDCDSIHTKQEENERTLEALKGFEMVNLNWMQPNHLGDQFMTDNVTNLDASAIQTPPESAFYSQQMNSVRALQNQIRQQQLRQYANNQSIYGRQTPPTTMLRTPPPSGGMQPCDPQSVNFDLSRKRSVPNDESHLPLDNNSGSGTLAPTEEDMMMRKRSKSFDIAMILSNQGGMTSRSSGQFLEANAFRDCGTQASPRYPGQLAIDFDSLRASHGRAVTTSLITDSNHGMGANPFPFVYGAQAAAHMKNPPPAQCGENIPSVPVLEEDADGDLESRPRKQRARYPGDLYTPQWVRYLGQSKEGFCDTCSPGKWLQLKNSAYWYHKQFFHGISSVSGKTFFNPLDQRVVEQDVVEGLCHQCNQWIPISSSKRKNCVPWYRHAHKCHIYHKPKNGAGMQTLP